MNNLGPNFSAREAVPQKMERPKPVSISLEQIRLAGQSQIDIPGNMMSGNFQDNDLLKFALVKQPNGSVQFFGNGGNFVFNNNPTFVNLADLFPNVDETINYTAVYSFQYINNKLIVKEEKPELVLEKKTFDRDELGLDPVVKYQNIIHLPNNSSPSHLELEINKLIEKIKKDYKLDEVNIDYEKVFLSQQPNTNNDRRVMVSKMMVKIPGAGVVDKGPVNVPIETNNISKYSILKYGETGYLNPNQLPAQIDISGYLYVLSRDLSNNLIATYTDETILSTQVIASIQLGKTISFGNLKITNTKNSETVFQSNYDSDVIIIPKD